ncbi:hypothetical protein L1987_76411 [Smallanthus sonchifolius]|uniref:Uncharacterized protein n=1 Tax=Smallanthus sonchifolius TaxID=185202 RepID=A0ACB9A8H9_9ASTR|nr:hypothetical protein L1987_76411 [Smallanthus sonchifolius]
MDSSNSGSFQSSSGGAGAGDNDEYDSRRTQSISSFFNPSTNINTNLNQLLQPPPTFYNPLQDPGSAWTGTIPQDFTTYPVNPNSSSMDTHTKTGHQVGVSMKNPKKRTRASRRAPTTVLTTDTTNFRQMVQEFTGIPTAPFTTASFSRRLDLFGGSLNPLRPSAQPQPPPFLNSTANIVESGTSTAATSSGNYQFAPYDFPKQPSTFLDSQNPMFSFQSLLQNSIPQDLQTSSKRWRDQNGKMETFEGVIGNTQNIGGSKLNSGIDRECVGFVKKW